MTDTITYYNENTKAFIDGTVNDKQYYSQEQLEQISIKSFSNALKNSNAINYSDELVDDLGSEFVLDNADVFRQGVCQLFAYALNEKYRLQ